MVPWEGLEPPTSPLGRACSIQLSYQGLGVWAAAAAQFINYFLDVLRLRAWVYKL